MKPKNNLVKKEIRKLIGCLENNLQRIHYRGDRIGGYPIRSGGIESANKFISHTRMKRSGAWWVKKTGNKMLAIRKTLETFVVVKSEISRVDERASLGLG